MKLFRLSKGNIPQRVLRLMLALTVVVFLAFFLIGYSHPYSEDPDFIEPRLTSTLLIYMLLIFVVAIGVTIWAVVSALRKRTSSKVADGVPATTIAIAVVVLTALTMVVSFLAGSASSMQVNGSDYENGTWLRAADMFVLSSIGLMIVATAVVAVATIRSHFKNRRK